MLIIAMVSQLFQWIFLSASECPNKNNSINESWNSKFVYFVVLDILLTEVDFDFLIFQSKHC